MKRHRTFCRTLALLLVLSVFGALALTAGPVPAAAAGADGGVDSGIPAGVIVVSDLDGISHKLIATPGITDGINQGLVGDDPKMIINGVEYKKGFCTHPVSAAEPSEITVDISRYSSDYPVFHVIAGKDYTTEGGGNGHTYRFEVLADGEVKYASEVLDLGDVAEIYVDVDGAQELSILCYSAGPFAWLTVDFADPYLCRRDTAPTAAPTEVPTEPPTEQPPTGEPVQTDPPAPTEKPKNIYLSDLDGIVHVLIDSPGITNGVNVPLTDKNGKLTVNGKPYDKGFCTHPVSGSEPSSITVDVAAFSSEYPVLHMTVGKDDSAAGGGTGHPYMYEVIADGESIYLSEALDLGDQEELYLNVAGARELELLCFCAGPFAWLTVDFVDVYLCDLEIKEVRMASAPLKVYYIAGEPLSVNGGELEVEYDNGYVLTVDIDGSMVSGFDPEKTGAQELTVKYGGAEFTYTVNVEPAPATKAPATDNTPAASSDPSGNGDPHSRTGHNSGRTAAIVTGAVCAAAAAAVAVVLIIKAHNRRKTK